MEIIPFGCQAIVERVVLAHTSIQYQRRGKRHMREAWEKLKAGDVYQARVE